MKAVILAGGLGTRISEETHLKPKPMVEIGGRPILWHIMKLYSAHGVHDFVICCGYKGYMIKEYFANYFLHMSDVTFDMANNQMEVHERKAEPWRVTLVDTGEQTMTGGRLKRVRDYIGDQSVLLHLWRRLGGCRHHATARLPSGARQTRHADRDPASRAFRCPQPA
jgi:glucose-1-phosphate cytidylyltransferase